MKEITITPPPGYEIDKEHSSFEHIKFKPIVKRWRDNENATFDGFFISTHCEICDVRKIFNTPSSYNTFANEKQARSALAMARLTQIIDNDERFGGVVSDEEWNDRGKYKYVIERAYNKIELGSCTSMYRLLAFHTVEQRDLFYQENEDLIREYFMLD